jgi:hypothetical protein
MVNGLIFREARINGAQISGSQYHLESIMRVKLFL